MKKIHAANYMEQLRKESDRKWATVRRNGKPDALWVFKEGHVVWGQEVLLAAAQASGLELAEGEAFRLADHLPSKIIGKNLNDKQIEDLITAWLEGAGKLYH